MSSTERPVSRLVSALAILFVILVILGVHFLQKSSQYTLEKGALHLKESGELFQRDIRAYGMSTAAARFATAVATFGMDDQHAYAHQFGHALYAIEGERGIGACDAYYGLGCFHQFLGDAIGDMGQDAIPRLYAKCGEIVGSVNSCQHGLGHGIVAGTGYTDADLRTALSLCDGVTKEKSYSGCYGGVFMEYSMRTIASAEQTMSARSTDDLGLYGPCVSLEGETRKICMFWLPQWWYFSALPNTGEAIDSRNDVYEKLGELCAVSPEKQACFEGIGYITPAVFAFDPLLGRVACDHVGPENNGSTYCRAMAGLIYHLTTGESDKAPVMCEGLNGKQVGICTAYQKHEGNFSFSLPE